MASEAFSGTETIGGTEWSLTTDTSGPDVETDDGVYQVFLDLNALAAGDIFELRLYEKVLSGSTQRLVESKPFSGAQGAPNGMTYAFTVLHGWDLTLIKIAGTDRAIDWSIRLA